MFISAPRSCCGKCGGIFGKKVWNSNNKLLRRVIWTCNDKYKTKGIVGCSNKHIDDGVLEKAFVNAFNGVVDNIDYYITRWGEMIRSEDLLQKYRYLLYERHH